jgi:hypothetical protein
MLHGDQIRHAQFFAGYARTLDAFQISRRLLRGRRSGEPWLGFSSMLNGEKPQSSVEPSRSFGMKFCCAY